MTIPIAGDVPKPKCGPWIQSPYLLNIDGLQVEGSVLRVIMKLHAYGLGLETDPPKTALEFELKPLFAAKKAS